LDQRGLIGQDVRMDAVLVSLPEGAGVVRRVDGATVVTDDVGEGHGTHLRAEDPYHPVKSWVDEDRSVVGGLLPPGAVSAEVVDDLGRRVEATIGGHGAYAAIVAQPNDGVDPIVCCRDATGRPVRRPLAGEYRSEPVTDAEEPCPACGAIAYAEYTPTEQWRGGRPGPGDVVIPNPVVVCCECGHEAPEGTFFGASASDDGEDEAERQARIARAQAEARVQQWYARTMLLRGATFPIYAADGWPARIGGSGSSGDVLTAITIAHDTASSLDDDAGPLRRLQVTTSIDAFQLSHELRHAREALEVWAGNQQPQMSWDGRSHAAITLWLAARRRHSRGLVVAAERTQQSITLDGVPQLFLILTTSTDSWVAVRTHHDLMITIAGHRLDRTGLALEPIADPTAQLVGPRPPEP
jgi:hypothetical protein